MDTQNTSRQFRYLEEVRIPLHRAGFETLPLEGEQLKGRGWSLSRTVLR